MSATPTQPTALPGEAKHSPLPWKINMSEDERSCLDTLISSKDGKIVAECNVRFTHGSGFRKLEANAAFIVEACNNYTTLRDTVRRMEEREKEWVETVNDLLFAAENADETGYVTDVGFIDLDAQRAKARQLLARVVPPTETKEKIP